MKFKKTELRMLRHCVRKELKETVEDSKDAKNIDGGLSVLDYYKSNIIELEKMIKRFNKKIGDEE